MNRKGFTLVELLATIIVLAIVVGITIPVTLSSINKAKERERNLLVNSIRTAVRDYLLECSSGINSFGESYCSRINDSNSLYAAKTTWVRDLATYGYLSNVSSLLDPVSGKDFADCELYIYNNGDYGFCGVVTDFGPNICPNFDNPDAYTNSYCWTIATER